MRAMRTARGQRRHDMGVMGKARAGGRQAFALGALFTCLLALSPSAYALNPALDVSQYAHTAWKIRDGFSQGVIYAIAQTPDGYLWLGTEFGLLRFDGVSAVPWQPPLDQQLPSSVIRSLLVARDGALWIGTERGLASWKDGKLTQYEALAESIVSKLVEDREGSIWATTFFHSRWTRCGGRASLAGFNLTNYDAPHQLASGANQQYSTFYQQGTIVQQPRALQGLFRFSF